MRKSQCTKEDFRDFSGQLFSGNHSLQNTLMMQQNWSIDLVSFGRTEREFQLVLIWWKKSKIIFNTVCFLNLESFDERIQTRITEQITTLPHTRSYAG